MPFADLCLLIIILLLVVMLMAFMASGFTGKPDPEGIRNALQNLRKSREDMRIAGVCAGLGVHTPLPAWIWRAVFLGLAFFGGLGFVAYVILWICMPAAKQSG